MPAFLNVSRHGVNQMSRSGCTATAVLLLLACGGGNDAPPPDAPPSADAMSAAAAAMTPVTTPVKLSEADMGRFVAALEELSALSEDYRDKTGGTEIGQMGVGLAANAEAMAILRRHDFKDALAFQRVAYSVGSAMGAAEMEGHSAEIEAATAKLEGMKSSMSEEQYNMMMKSQQQAKGMVSDQPAGNVALVKAWKDRIEAAAGKDQ